MRKRVISLLAVLWVSLVVVQPVQAQEANGFAKFWGGVRAQFQRLYLQLPGEKPGRAVLEQMLLAMESVETARVTSSTLVEVEPDESAPYAAQVDTDGVASIPEWFDPGRWQQQATFNASLASQDLSLAGNGTWVQDGGTHYLMFSDLPIIPLVNTSRAKGMWMRVEPVQMETQPEWTEENQAQLRQATVDLLQSAEVSTARRETLDDQAIFAIDVVLSDEALTTYIKRVSELRGNEASHTEAVIQRAKNILNSLGPVATTLYVDRATYYLRRIMIPLEAPLSQVGNGVQTGVARVTTEINLDDYNQPVVVDVPAEAREWTAVMNEVMTGEEGEDEGGFSLDRLREELRDNSTTEPTELEAEE